MLYLLQQEICEYTKIEERNLQEVIKNAAGEALGKRVRLPRKGELKIQNDELKAVLKEKKGTYLNWIQNRDM